MVYIKKLGDAIILIPEDHPWSSLLISLDEFSEDFMSDRNQPTLQKRDDLRNRTSHFAVHHEFPMNVSALSITPTSPRCIPLFSVK